MAIYIAPRNHEKAILGPGAASMMTLAPLYGAVRNPRQMMRLAQQLYHSNRYVYKAESTISFAFSTVDWHLEDGEDNEILMETATGPTLAALSLMEKPQAMLQSAVGQNLQGLTRSQLWNLISRHMGLCGSAFVLGDQRDGLANTPLALLYINPARMTPAEDNSGNLTGWVLDAREDGYGRQTGTPLGLDEVYHFKLNEPDSGHFGIGNVESFWSADRITSLSDQHATDVLAAGGRLTGIVSAKAGGTIPDNVFQQMIRDFRTINDQPDSAKHMTVVQGPIDFTRTTATATELNLLELMKMSKGDTYEHWGVPLSQIGGETPAGLNSGDVRKYDRAAMWQNAIHPRLTSFWEVIQYQLLDRFQKLGAIVEFELEEPEFDDDSPRYDLLQKSINIAMTNAERRALIGLDPFGDPVLDDAIYLPVTLTLVDTAQNAGPEASASQQALGRATPAQTQTQDQTSAASAAAGETSQGGMSGKARISHPVHRSLRKLRANVEKTATPAIRKGVAAFLAAQKREIAAHIRSLPPYRLKDPEHVFPKKAMKDWDARLGRILKPHLAGMAEVVHDHVLEVMAPAGKAGPAGAVNYVLTRGAARVTGINQTTRDGLAEIIASGLDEGLSPAALGDAVEAWSGFDEYRSEMIARTELADAYNASALSSYGEIGVSQVEAIDGDGDEECAARDGQTFSVDEADSIEDHPNGTLDWNPIFSEET